MTTALQTLVKYWGFTSFIAPQEEVIAHVLEGKEVCAFLPTGGGKSICFQVPALCKEGICIVISPLIALMQDQVDALSRRGIGAVYLKAGMRYSDVSRILDNCIYGKIKFLYLSPERLQQEMVQERIKEMNVNLIAVDEAHCISQWGHDFRPAYRNIHLLKNLHPSTPMIAVTATATREVQLDIQEALTMKQPAIVKKSFERTNIALKVCFSHDKFDSLLDLLSTVVGVAIVYVRSRGTTTELSTFLNQHQIPSLAYNGGMEHAEREKIVQQWLREEVRVIVATNAFGMGIDKPNVRQVIHFHLPENLESYYQEVGRCGRDGHASEATILYNKSDIKRLKQQFIDVIPDLATTIEIFKKLTSYFRIAYGEGQDQTFDFNIHTFCKKYEFKTHLVFQTLDLLERLSILTLHKSSFKQSQIQFTCSQHQLFDYLDKHTAYRSIVQAVLRTYGGVFDNAISIDFNLIAEQAKTSKTDVVSCLQQLMNLSFIKGAFYFEDLSITLLVPKEDERSILLHSKYIKNYKLQKYEKAKSVVDFVRNKEVCRSRQLMLYFGEEASKECGVCSVCTKEEIPYSLMNIEYKKVALFIEKQLTIQQLGAKSLIKMGEFKKEEIIATLQKLLDQKKIELNSNNTYKLKR